MSQTQNYHGLYYPNLDFVKQNLPKWTIVGRNYMPNVCSAVTPGPNQYKADYVKHKPRSATMGIRHSEFCSTGLPAHFLIED